MGTTELSLLAAVLAAAVLCGLLLNRYRQPAAVGFILAGVVLGPTGFHWVTNSESVQTLADLGVLMLLFIIGMEMRLQSFAAMLPTALGVTLVQIAMSVGVPVLAARFMGIEIGQAIVIGFMLAISSTALSMKMMADTEEKNAPSGRLATAILIAQDLAVVPMLLITQSLGAPDASIWPILLRVIAAMALLGGFIAYLNRVKSFRFPFSEFILKDTDIGTIAILGLCFGAAALSGLVGLSPALGAFLMGVVVGHSTLRRVAVRVAQPVQSILLFVFFLSVGLLIDLSFIGTNMGVILVLLTAAVLLRTYLNLFILLLFGQPLSTAFQAALFLAPIGEFSFVLAAVAASSGVLDANGHKVAIAVIALSLLASPIWFSSAHQFHALATTRIKGLHAKFLHLYGKEIFMVLNWRPVRMVRQLIGLARARREASELPPADPA